MIICQRGRFFLLYPCYQAVYFPFFKTEALPIYPSAAPKWTGLQGRFLGQPRRHFFTFGGLYRAYRRLTAPSFGLNLTLMILQISRYWLCAIIAAPKGPVRIPPIPPLNVTTVPASPPWTCPFSVKQLSGFVICFTTLAHTTYRITTAILRKR